MAVDRRRQSERLPNDLEDWTLGGLNVFIIPMYLQTSVVTTMLESRDFATQICSMVEVPGEEAPKIEDQSAMVTAIVAVKTTGSRRNQLYVF